MPQAQLRSLPIAEIGRHQGFPKFAVVGDGDVKEFVNDHVIP
jgi:hypothetical protein